MGWVSPAAQAHQSARLSATPTLSLDEVDQLSLAAFKRMTLLDKTRLSQEHPQAYDRLIAELISESDPGISV